MTFLLHRGAEEIDHAMLQQLETPPGTDTRRPIPHRDVVEMVRHALGCFGHEVIEEHHAITEGGERYFGLLVLRSAYGDYTDTVGLRNSPDKSVPVGIAIGARVFVCDNLSFIGDHVIKRRHTQRAKRDLPGLVAEVVEPLAEHRQRQQQTFARYREARLSTEIADHAIMQLYRRDVINLQRIATVARPRDDPAEDWGSPTAWRIFNATTSAASSSGPRPRRRSTTSSTW